MNPKKTIKQIETTIAQKIWIMKVKKTIKSNKINYDLIKINKIPNKLKNIMN